MSADAIAAMKRNGFFQALARELERHPEAGFDIHYVCEFAGAGFGGRPRYKAVVTMTATNWDEKHWGTFVADGKFTYTRCLERKKPSHDGVVCFEIID